ncbi:MAG: 2-oxoacid:acceptor oxidoreductase family protein [Candidatus Latescibacteria bacterium]|jgi:2-oxoglutarate ferredoxin oxidoreductase subunit gamma|nr:2-oxoacid:acceptor oxidoreductase family protein [Candidatus Latescibacterota bacterium]
MSTRTEILASGFGGQGVVRLGQILGEAAVNQGYRVTMLKSHGTEMRGGYVRSQVVFSEDPIDSPIVEDPHYFAALSLAAYNAFKHLVKEGGILYDPAFVSEVDEGLSCEQKPVPAKDLSVENFGRPVFANTIVLGTLAKRVDPLDGELVLESILRVFPRYHEENRQAFEIGYALP